MDLTIAAIESAVATIEARQIEEERLAAERKKLTDRLRNRLQDHKVELAELRREIEALYSPQQLASRVGREFEVKMTPNGPYQSETGSGASAEQSPLAELEAKLGKEDWGRLQTVKQYYLRHERDRWKPGMELAIGRIWRRWRELPDSDSPRQWPVFWSMTAVAIWCGKAETDPPYTQVARKIYQDPDLYLELARIFLHITGDEKDASYFIDTDDSPKSAETRFIKAYERACAKFTASPNDGEIRPETINS